MKIDKGVLEEVNIEDVGEDGVLVCPEGIKEIGDYTFSKIKRDVKGIILPKSIEKIGPKCIEHFDLKRLYVPDGVEELKIFPYTQLYYYEDDHGYICHRYLRANYWEYLRLPKGFKVKNSKDEDEILQNDLLVVNLESLERILENGEYNGEDVIINIKNVSELSSEKAKELQKKVKIKSIQIIDIERQSDNHEPMHPYDLETYIKCREKIDEIISKIDVENLRKMPDGEKRIFCEVVKQLSSIVYDKTALRCRGTAELQTTCRNLQGGLLDGTCVCVGYSEILRNVLACLGIDSKLISGYGHCWNQVKLDGKWYNVDLTFDQPRILKGRKPKNLLKSDKDFKHHSKMILDFKKSHAGSLDPRDYSLIKLEECDETVPDKVLMDFLYGDREVEKEETEDSQEKFFPIKKRRKREFLREFIQKKNLDKTRLFSVVDRLMKSKERDEETKND